MTAGESITRSIRAASKPGFPALIPYLTAGFPTRADFAGLLASVAPHAAAIEIGVPFTDPMADGVTLQRTSRVALQQGATLRWVLDAVAATRPKTRVPILLMGYLNPFLRLGLSELAAACAASGVDGLIVPDLPLEEAGPLRVALHAAGVGLVQLVSPVTPAVRAEEIARTSDGFLYAVTTAGVTGGKGGPVPASGTIEYLRRLRATSPVPVCAGFGIRTRTDVAALAEVADGVIVGSALMEQIEQGRDPGAWLASLRRGDFTKTV